MACGAIVVSLVLARRPIGRFVGPALFSTVVGYGIATIVFALSRNFALSVAMLAFSGAFDAISVVIRGVLVQLETPDEMRGRVSAVNQLCTSSSGSIGQIESGLVAGWLGGVPSAVIGGVGTIVVALAWMGLFPQMVRIDRFDDWHDGVAGASIA